MTQETIARLESKIDDLQATLRRPALVRDLLTEDEAAAVVGCSKSNLRRLHGDGKLRKRYPNFERCYHPADLETYGRGVMPEIQRGKPRGGKKD